MRNPKLFAFDLDGTLLNDHKRISPANAAVLRELIERDIIVAFASGRLGSSMKQFLPELGMDLAMLTLNGADVFMDSKHANRRVYSAPLDAHHSDHLIRYAKGKPFALNFYFQDRLYTVKDQTSSPWIDLYYQQTSSNYNYLDSFEPLAGKSPSKIIFIGDPAELDRQEELFRSKWDSESIYICRTWMHYLEFLNVKANKGIGLEALASAYGFNLDEVVAFGDADNDIPMLSRAGLGVAMKNSEKEVRDSADRVTEFTNDQDGIAHEWQRIKMELGW